MTDSFPTGLHRYLSLQDNSDCWMLFGKKLLTFSNPRFFNDPFDVFPRCDRLVEKHLAQLVEREFAFLPAEDTRFPAAELVSYHRFKERPDWKHREALLRLRAKVDYPVRFRNGIAETAAVLCLSEKAKDLLMLSHYADKHRGIVVELDPERLNPLGRLQPINYECRRPDAEIHSTTDILYTKTKDWKYEAEVRLICPTNALRVEVGSPKHCAEISPLAVKAVRLGMCANLEVQNHKRLLDLLLSSDWEHVRILQLSPSADRFALEEFELNRCLLGETYGIPAKR